MRPIPPNLAARLRRGDSPLRYPVEAHVITRASIKQTKADWQAGDGPPSGSDFEFVADGGLRIAPSISALISSSTGSSFFTDLNADFPFLDAFVSLGGTEDPNVEVMRVKANLHPNRDGTGRTVVWWRCRLFAVAYAREIVGLPRIGLAPLGSPIDVQAAGDAAGDVTFDFSALPVRPRPKLIRPEINDPGLWVFYNANYPEYLHPCLIVRITAHKADGSAATNVGWGYDSTIQTFGTGNVLRSKQMHNQFPGPIVDFTLTNGEYVDRGSAGGVPKISVETGSFTQKVITFSSGNLLDLGAAPTGPVVLAGLADTPIGSSVTFEIRNDADSAYVPYTDGQTFADLGLTATQTRKVRATLTPNSAGNVTPTLRRLGMEEKTIKDLSHVAHITRYNQHVDPVTLEGRITTATLRAIKNGRRDFRAAIEDLLSENDLANIEIRWYSGDTRLAKKDRMLIDAFEIEDWDPEASGVSVMLLGANAKVQAKLPKFDLSGSGIETPDSTVTNPGAWTDQAGGSTNIHLTIDEDPPDDTDYIRSPLSPSNAVIEVGLSNIADPGRDTGHFVDLRLKKDATGGEVLELQVELRQGAVVKMTSAPIVLPDEWTDVSLALSLAQAQSISDYTDLRIRLDARVASGSGARRVQVSWAQFRVVGQRTALVYTNQTATAVYADLLSQAEVPGRVKGQGLTETDVVSKTITDANALSEMRALVSNFGKAVIGTRGVIQVVDMYGGGGIVAYLSKDSTKPLRITPGLRERRPRQFVRWNYNYEKNRFDDEAFWQNTVAITKLGHSRIDALDQHWPEEAGKWVYSKALAQAIARRTGQALAAGLILWPFRLLDARPELECGDRVSLATNRFLSRDPNASRALRGNLGALATVCDVTYENGFWDITGWVQGNQDIFGAPGDDASLPKPAIREGAIAWRGDHAYATWTGDSKTQSVKVAASTSALPAAGTGTAADGQNGEYDAGAFTYAQQLYVTITPYTGLGGTGVQGEAFFIKHRLPHIETMFDFTTGKPLKTTAFNEQGSVIPTPVTGTPFSYNAGGPAGPQMWLAWTWSAFTVYRPDGTTLSIPASSSMATPPTPTLSEVAGGALGARTRYVMIGYVRDGKVYKTGAEASFAISANNLLKVTAPSAVAGYTGWCVLVGSASNAERYQVDVLGSGEAFGSDWTEPSGGADVTGHTPWHSNQSNAITEIALDPSTTYYWIPFYHIADALVNFFSAFTSDTPANAVEAVKDGRIPLAYRISGSSIKLSVDALTPSGGSTGSGSKGGKF